MAQEQRVRHKPSEAALDCGFRLLARGRTWLPWRGCAGRPDSSSDKPLAFVAWRYGHGLTILRYGPARDLDVLIRQQGRDLVV